MNYQILMDVSGDVIPAFAEAHGIGFLPMGYTLREENRVCEGMESRETLKLFYDGQRSGDLTQTTQIPPSQYESLFEPYLQAGQAILCLCLSGGLSSTFQSANLAAAELAERYPDLPVLPLDTFAATGGMGVLAERAARNKEAGMDIRTNYEDLVEATHHIRHFFFVQDLMYLRRGGRVSGAEAVLGTALNIRPVMMINPEGKLEVIDKKHGTKQAVRALASAFEAHYNPDAGDVVYITDGDTEESADAVEQAVREHFPDAVIRRIGLSPIIGAHTGPGAVTLDFMGK